MTESNQTPETATATAAVPTLTLDVASMAKDKADLEDAVNALEKTGASLTFGNLRNHEGAQVTVTWPREAIAAP